MDENEAFVRAIHNEPEERTHRLVYADWLDEHGDERRAQAMRHGVVKRFGIDFDSPGGALTLGESDIGAHADGWMISGKVHEDWYTWVNDFEASHPVYGMVWGDFESLVFASSEASFQHFWKHHEPTAWDYQDI